jgi:hypothetical protein
MQVDEPTDLPSMPDRTRCEPELAQLRVTDDTILPARERRDLPV